MTRIPLALLALPLATACAPGDVPCAQQPVNPMLAYYAPSLGDLAYAGCTRFQPVPEPNGRANDDISEFNDEGQLLS